MLGKLLVLVLSGGWMSSNEQMVVKYESSKSVRAGGGVMMRGLEFRSLINLW